MNQIRQMIYGILIGLIAAGGILLISNQDRGIPIALSPAPTLTQTSLPKSTNTPPLIQVQIGGEVLRPGIYDLPFNSRLTALINLASGLSTQADYDRVNQAALIKDGDYFYIPAVGEDIPETASNAPKARSEYNENKFEYPLDLNTTTQDALESLPGIGPTKASEILAYRDKVGRFSAVEELLNVPGIGQATLETIRDFVVCEP